MVLNDIVQLLLALGLLSLAFAIFTSKGNIVFTVKVEQLAADIQKVETEISDLQKHYTEAMSKEEEAYYKESVGVLQTLNEILSGKIPEDNGGNE